MVSKPTGSQTDPETAARHGQAVERVIAVMREETDEPPTLEAMSEIAYLSPYHFARVFRRVTGVPPGEFLAALRLERAKELLLTTDLSASEVCYEVGYTSLGTFTTRFTRLVGVSPGRMRHLPEVLHDAAGTPREDSLSSSGMPGVEFNIRGQDLAGRWMFAGLFPGAIPQRQPVAGTLLDAPGLHLFPFVPDGCYQLMAAALPRSENPLDSLLPGDSLRVGRGPAPVVVHRGRAPGIVDLEMRATRATDPPVLLALPALLPGLLVPGLSRGHKPR